MERISRPRRTDEVDMNRPKIFLFNDKLPNPNHRVNNRLMNKKSMDRKNYQVESTEDEDDDDDTLSACTNDKLGLCATCNLVIVESNDGSCTPKPLVCHRCIKRLDNRSSPPFDFENNCTVCHSDSQQSLSNYSQDSVEYVNHSKHSARTYSLSQTSIKSDMQNVEGGYFIQASPTDRRFPMFSRSSSVYEYELQNQPPSESRHRTNHQTSYYNMVQKENSIASNSSEMKVNYQTLECSRRPIRCPKLDCAMNVAFSALTHHFLFDHPEVPVISIDPEMKSTVVFRSSSIACDSSRCLALLLVSDKLPEGAARLFNGSQIHAKYRNRLPLPVLAARLRRRSLFTSTNDMNGGDVVGDGEVIIIWITGLDVGGKAGTLRCSIQAMDSIEDECIRSLTYTGPINSLRTAQCPRQVLQNGDCLVLHEGFVKNVSSDHTSLNVNFVVH